MVAEYSCFLLAGSLPDNPGKVVRGLVVALRFGLLAAIKKMLSGLSDCSKGVSSDVRQQLEAWDKVAGTVQAPEQAATSTIPGLHIWSDIHVRLQNVIMQAFNAACKACF